MANFTFGVEIEFFIRSKLPGSDNDFFKHAPGPPLKSYSPLQDYFSDADRELHDKLAVRTSVAKALRQIGLNVKPDCGNNHMPFPRFPNPAKGPGYYLEEAYERNDGIQSYDQWWITDDILSRPTDSNYSWWAIEVVSPVYNFSPESLDEVQRAINQLTSKFHIEVNKSCGLHVHVGHGASGFSLVALKNLFKFFVAFEPQLELLHPKHRRGRHHIYSAPLRFRSELADKFQTRYGKNSDLPLNVAYALHEISKHQSTNGVISDWDKQKIVAITPRALALPGTKKTIEFRQHESTVDPNRIRAWIELVVQMVAKVESYNPNQLDRLMLQHYGANHSETNPGQCTTIQLFRLLGISEAVVAFYQDKLYTDSFDDDSMSEDEDSFALPS